MFTFCSPRKVNLSRPMVERMWAKTGSTIAGRRYVDETALRRIDLLFHLLGEALRFSLKEIDLSRFCPVGVSQTFLAELTGEAVGLVASELDGLVAFDRDIASV
jgi:hypothetical protein